MTRLLTILTLTAIFSHSNLHKPRTAEHWTSLQKT